MSLVFLLGCTSTGWHTEKKTPAPADWNDVRASVVTGASQVEMAVVGELPVEQSKIGLEQRFLLRTSGDEPVTLTASRRSADDAGPSPIELSASVGRLGSPSRERALIEAVRKRLEQLAGVDHSPIR